MSETDLGQIKSHPTIVFEKTNESININKEQFIELSLNDKFKPLVKYVVLSDLDLGGNTNIVNMPNHLEVFGFLNLEGTNVKQLPNSLNILSGLFCKNLDITLMPSQAVIGSQLNMNGTSVSDLNGDLHVGGIASFVGTGVKEVPGHVTIHGEFRVS